MANDLNRSRRHILCWFIYACAVGGWAHYCTRGEDGRLFGAMFGACILAIVYCGIAIARRWWLRDTGMHFLVFEAATIAGSLIDSHLEEMAGMLYLILPIFVALIIAAGLLVQTVRKSWKDAPDVVR